MLPDFQMFFSGGAAEFIDSFINHLLLSLQLIAVGLNNHEILGRVLVDAKSNFHETYV